ncbi:MAG: hypothetical protein HZB47_02450 [Nitrosomonadales bacterium]|nr:hypothetical protein [Nitrosomonadales bacterium]
MKSFPFFRLMCGLLPVFAFPAIANAQPLDDVSLEYQNQGVVATIRMTGPVQYLRHFPESHGNTLEIYYDRVAGATSNEAWTDGESRKSPPTNLIPGFTVTTRDQQTKPKLVIEFSGEAEYSVAAGKDKRSLLVTILPVKRRVSDEPLPFLPTVKPVVKAAASPTLTPEQQAAIAETNIQAHDLMAQGRDALAAKNNEAAVEILNKLLLLPPNDYTQDGQEWIGVARERAGQDAKAKVEYDLYLRLYPEGAGAARTAQRLAGLSGVGKTKLMSDVPEKKQASSLVTYGSVSSRYYYGKSTIETNHTFNSTTTTDTQSLTDQSMLITSVDVSERYRSEEKDARLVFRDTNTRNFLSNQPSQNRVSAAYGEIKGRTQDYLLRVGRQSAAGGGVLGRFDGIAGSYGNAENLRANAVAGALADYSQGSKPRFYGASVDKGMFSLYGITQTLDGTLDRRAVGTEVRYFDDNNTVFALLDYDTYFKAVNAAQLMGTAKLANASVNMMVDHRKAPSLSIRNALNGASVSSVSALLQTMSASSLRDLALLRTANSNMGQVGITVPLREKWQAGGDFRISNTTGLAASGTAPTGGATAPEGYVEAIPSRGTEKSVTGQIIGSGIYKEGDVWSGSISFSTSSAVNGRSLYVYNHTQLNKGWMVDTSLQLSGYKDQYGGKTTRTSPMLRGSYQFKERLNFDVDCGIEYISYSGIQMSSKTRRFFYSGGLRWDF